LEELQAARMMRIVAVFLSFQLLSALQFKNNMVKLESEIDSELAEADEQPECNGCKYAYVTMWIAKDELPEQMKKKWRHAFKVEEGESAISDQDGAGLLDSTEKELQLSDEMESDAMEYESELARFTNHLSGKDAIWELAGNMQYVGTKYPLIVLTNEKNGILAEKAQLKEKYPNIEIVELKDYLWPKCTMRKDTITHFQKLNILGMDKYDKLLWIDVDIRLRKSIDYTFNLNVDSTTYFMKDDWYCGAEPLTNGGYSSGLMLFKPNKKLLEHTYEVSTHMGDCWGDQVVIQRAMKKAYKDADGESKKMQMKWIPSKTIRYPQCDKRQSYHADAIHFVKVKKGFVTPDKIYNPEEAPHSDM
jgi:hypothetical protein